MRKFILFIFFILAYHFSHCQWKQQHFIIGTYLDPNTDSVNYYANKQAYEATLKQVKDAYFNFLTGTTTATFQYSRDYFNFKLNLLSQLGIHTLYKDFQFRFRDFDTADVIDAIKFTKRLSPGERKFLDGYYLLDEPFLSDSTKVRAWIRTIKKYASHSLAYVNLYPIYALDDSKTLYEKYLDTYLSNPAPSESLDVVSYDFYPFMADGSFRDHYFYNLGLLKQKAKGRPIWYYPLTVEHGPYNTPDKYELMFMVYCPIAYGAKGLIYFTYETVPSSRYYTFGDGIVSKSGSYTNKFELIKTINRFVSQIVGPMVMESKNLGTYHISGNPYNQDIPADEYINNEMPVLSKFSNEPLMAGIFQDTIRKDEYNLLFVNKASYSVNNAFITLRGNLKGKVYLSARQDEYEDGDQKFTSASTTYESSTNETELYLNFEPGEARIIKVKNVTDPYASVINPANYSLNIYPNPAKAGNIININYTISQKEEVSFRIFAANGKLVDKIIDKATLLAGKYRTKYSFAANSPAGIYYVSMSTKTKTITQPIVIVK